MKTNKNRKNKENFQRNKETKKIRNVRRKKQRPSHNETYERTREVFVSGKKVEKGPGPVSRVVVNPLEESEITN